MSMLPLPGARNGMFEAVFGGARPRTGTPPFSPEGWEQSGGANVPTTPETLPAKRGLAGFFDRVLNPTNALGQFGQALVAGGGGPLGNAMAYMMQQRQASQQPSKFDEWRQQYDYERANPKDRAELGLQYFDDNAGNRYSINPTTGEQKLIFTDPNDKQFVVDGQLVTVPNRVRAGSLAPPSAAPQGALGAPEIGAVLPDPRKGGATGNGRGGFPVSGSRLDQITAQAESGNRDYAGGRPVVSPAGARFAMQVMPATARDPGFGLRPADPNDPADMNRLGREYRAAMQKRYGGDPAKMWAAYNAGPGRVDDALASGGDWLSRMPAETRNYVSRNLRALRER